MRDVREAATAKDGERQMMEVDADSCSSVVSPASEIVRSTVAEVMVRYPKVLPDGAAVSQVRAVFEDDHVHMVLLTRGGYLSGTVIRGDVPGTAPDHQEAACFARIAERTVSATASADAVMQRLTARGQRRLAVVDKDGLLVGLLCLKARGSGFCSDADVTTRKLARDR